MRRRVFGVASRRAGRGAVLLAGVLAGLMAGLLACGCTTIITPPASVRDPVGVYVLDYGYHASLAVPAEDGRVVEFAYGEWGWYAEGRRGWWRAPGVVLWPSQGALGRRVLHVQRELIGAASGAERAAEVRVERETLDTWRAGMLARWDAAEAAAGSVENSAHAMAFVKVEEDYWVFRTCNSAVARWLRELGCETSWGTVTADFEVRGAGERAEFTPPPDGR